MLYSVDLDVLISTLFFLIRQAFRVNSQKSYRHNFEIAIEKLKVLAERWTPRSLLETVTSSETLTLIPEEFKFYRTDGVTDENSSQIVNQLDEGWVRMPIPSVKRDTFFENLQQQIAQYKVPESEHFRLFHFLRIRYSLWTTENARKSALIRILGITIAGTRFFQCNL